MSEMNIVNLGNKKESKMYKKRKTDMEKEKIRQRLCHLRQSRKR